MLKFTINRKSLETIYFAYIRSLLEYADVLWDNCTQQQCNEIEKIQLEAGRIVTGATKLVEIDKLYKELGWLKLSERRDLHKLFLFFKMNHGLSPLYLSNLLPLHVGELSSYRLRNAENYVGIHANTHAYAESFLPSTLQAWNNLPEAVRSADTLGAFKHLLTLDTPKVPAYYDCGDRLDQISHTRLRTECSSLNQHLFRRNLVQNPYCLCGEIEDNKHFLLTCPRHTQMRAEMVLSIQQKTNVELTQMFCFSALTLFQLRLIHLFSKQCRNILNFPSVSLSKNNKIILTLFDRFSGYWGGWRTNCFAVCARSLNSMITL